MRELGATTTCSEVDFTSSEAVAASFFEGAQPTVKMGGGCYAFSNSFGLRGWKALEIAQQTLIVDEADTF